MEREIKALNTLVAELKRRARILDRIKERDAKEIGADVLKEWLFIASDDLTDAATRLEGVIADLRDIRTD